MAQTVRVLESPGDIAPAAAEVMASAVKEAILCRQRCIIALSGGSSVSAAYSRLAGAPGIEWSRVFVFWGDERFVPLDNPLSNYALAKDALISRLPGLPSQNVFPAPVDASTPADGARIYGETIRTFFGLANSELPRFDLVQNGVGPDGHTGSIFPQSDVVESGDIVAASHAGLAPWVDRLSMTIPVFRHAGTILVIATGQAKAIVLREILEGSPAARHLPAAGLVPDSGNIIWLLDRASASLLTKEIISETHF